MFAEEFSRSFDIVTCHILPQSLCPRVYCHIFHAKALFIWGKTPNLPDPGLTSEVNISDCLHEIFHLTCQPRAER